MSCERAIRYGLARSPAALLAGVLVLALGAALGSAQQVSAAQHEWSADARDALDAYRAGEFDIAQQLCRHLARRTEDERAQRDAAVVQALCLMRSAARADRVDGRERLLQLAQDDPTLRAEPECNLALGIAQTALYETADALDALDRGVESFAAQGLTLRQLAALVALAEAWAKHGEWEVTPPRFRISRPASAAAADAQRRRQIETVRARVARLPAHEQALADVDLILARHLIAAGDAPGEGHSILAELAAQPQLTPAGVEAALLLAEHYESLERWPLALGLYERVRREWHGEPARRAAERAQRITRPQLILDAPAAVASGEAVRVGVRVRGLPAVQLEVRRVDVEAWLGSARTRGSEALLPATGSVRLARDLNTRVPEPYEWWDSGALDDPLEFTAEPGAYVVLAGGDGADGRLHQIKRLVVISDLTATCLVGARRVLVWATRRPATAGADFEQITGKFWMTRSFAPTLLQFDAGIARFPLPNEAWVMRDKGWVCLVQAGAHLAVCRGQLTDQQAARAGMPQLAMVGGPPAPRVGESFHIAGLVLPTDGETVDAYGDAPLELDVSDAVDHSVFNRQVSIEPGGAFAVEVPITPELAGKHLHVVARRQRRTMDNLTGKVTARVPNEELVRYRVWLEVPEWIDPAVGVLSGCVRAEYPWGAPASGAWVACTLQAVRLPTTGSHERPMLAGVLNRGGRVDEDGRFEFALSTGEFGVSGVPLHIALKATVSARTGVIGWGAAEVLYAPDQPHAWLTHEPDDPHVGQPIRFQVGWFTPGGWAAERYPELEVRQAGDLVARLRLAPHREGLRTAPWRPTRPGTYEASVCVPAADGPPLRLQSTIVVATASPSRPADERLRCAAHGGHEGPQPGVHVRLEGAAEGPLLVLIEDGEPRAARMVGRVDGTAELFLPWAEGSPAGGRVLVIEAGRAGAELRALCEIEPDPAVSVEVDLTPPADAVWPGTTVPVRVACRTNDPAGGDVTLTARLVTAASSGYVEPQRGARPAETPLSTSLSIVPFTTAAGKAGDVAMPVEGAQRTATTRLWSALAEGATLWTTCVGASAGEQTELPVVVPADPGLYRLLVMARTPAGVIGTGAVVLDARRGIRARLDLPEQLTLGDRTQAAILLENGRPEPVEAELSLRAGNKLHLESVRVASPRSRVAHPRAGEAVTVPVPAAGSVWVYAELEAAEPGKAVLAVEVAAAGGRHQVDAACEVFPVDAASGARLTREVLVWTAYDEEPEIAELDHDEVVSEPTDEPWVAVDEHASHGHARRHWTSTVWKPGTRLKPGQYLEVRETLELQEALPGLSWTQRIPATCHGTAEKRSDLHPIGVPRAGRTTTLTFRVAGLEPTTHTHEYLLVVARPGACILPAPELRVGDRRIPVAVEPEELRLIVVGRD